MKKFYSLLCLLLIFVGGVETAWADTETVPTLSTDGDMHYYTIKNIRTGNYLYWLYGNKSLKQNASVERGGYFYFTKGENSTDADGVIVVKIHNVMTNTLMAGFDAWNAQGIDWYVKVSTATIDNTSRTGISFSKSTTYGSTNDSWNDYNSSEIGPYSVDGGSIFDLEEVEKPSFEVSIANGSRFVLENFQHTGKYIKSAGNELGRGDYAYSYACEFTFLKQDNGTYKIYNSYSKKYLSSLPVEGGNRGYGYDLNVPLVESADEAQEYKISLASGKSNHYTIQSTQTNITDEENAASARSSLHMGGNGIVRWEADAEASIFNFIDATTGLEQAWNNVIKSRADAIANVGTEIGSYVSNDGSVKIALDAFNAASEAEKGAAYAELEAAIKKVKRNEPETGKYYVIKSACYAGTYIGEDYAHQENGGNRLYSDTYSSNSVPTYWQFEPCTTVGYEDLFYIKAANSNHYISKAVWGYTMNLVDSKNGRENAFDIFTREHVKSGTSNVTLVTYTNDQRSDRGTARIVAGGNGIGSLQSYNDAIDDNQFFISEVTSVPVTISSANYATLHLPFAVNIPSGVRAFIGVKNDNDQIILKELTGVVPAKTPVILAGNEGSYDFAINYDDQTATPSSALSGTLVPYTIEDGVSAYVLKNGTKGVGLYKVTSTTDKTIGANKAYFKKEVTSNEPASFSFNFDETTGIHEAAAGNDAEQVYYDLNGRRVLYPVHGIFVKGNGEKVYIK